MKVPQQQHRSMLYRVCVALVLEHEGLYYDALVDALASLVHDDQALIAISQKRRRAISETDRRAIDQGKRYTAHRIIDRAHRNGRITYLDRSDTAESRTVWLGDPPKGGGRYGIQRSWDDERANITDETRRLLDRSLIEHG